eukprot:1145431-Pelagomonas_calceolata.AAC.12
MPVQTSASVQQHMHAASQRRHHYLKGLHTVARSTHRIPCTCAVQAGKWCTSGAPPLNTITRSLCNRAALVLCRPAWCTPRAGVVQFMHSTFMGGSPGVFTEKLCLCCAGWRGALHALQRPPPGKARHQTHVCVSRVCGHPLSAPCDGGGPRSSEASAGQPGHLIAATL